MRGRSKRPVRSNIGLRANHVRERFVRLEIVDAAMIPAPIWCQGIGIRIAVWERRSWRCAAASALFRDRIPGRNFILCRSRGAVDRVKQPAKSVTPCAFRSAHDPATRAPEPLDCAMAPDRTSAPRSAALGLRPVERRRADGAGAWVRSLGTVGHPRGRAGPLRRADRASRAPTRRSTARPGSICPRSAARSPTCRSSPSAR